MATNMATNAGVETVSDGDPKQVVPPSDVQEVSQDKEQNPYSDFASAEPPEIIQPSPQETRIKRVDPRHQWINTDKAIPYFCKLCDYTADCSEVGEACFLRVSMPYNSPNAIFPSSSPLSIFVKSRQNFCFHFFVVIYSRLTSIIV